jgi:hypothetical protein
VEYFLNPGRLQHIHLYFFIQNLVLWLKEIKISIITWNFYSFFSPNQGPPL